MRSDPPDVGSAIREAALLSPGGRIPFERFMDLALYHRPGGYYASRPARQRPGRGGDFYTSVSVGRCFGFLLARQLAETRRELGDPVPVSLVDCGGYDGQLARDIAEASSFPVETVVVEQGEGATRLADLAARPVRGLILANELVDAFPVHRVRFRGGRWTELYVDADLRESEGPLSDPRLARLGEGFPEGYTTEINLRADAWLAEAFAALDTGLLLVIDYGYESEEYYAPHRVGGTLRTYAGHRAGDNPLALPPGSCDITAHVDFSALRRAAEAVGFRAAALEDQHHYLTRLATPWLRELESDPAHFAAAAPLLRQFKTLTHPGIMGRTFRVLALRK
ncbi:SAM-dependent methyltransferase [soil metagenome]